LAKKKSCEAIRSIIEDFYCSIRDIRFLSEVHIGLANEIQANNISKYREEIGKAHKLLKSSKKDSNHKGELILHHALTKYLPFSYGFHADTLARSLFIFTFACFDAFVGNLLREIFMLKKEQQHTIEKTLNLDDLNQYKTVAQLRSHLIEKEISSFTRDSYDKQFKDLEKRFGIRTLREFPKWPEFIEASQRRHLFTHCEGIVSANYITTCKATGCKIPSAIKVGEKLDLMPKYHHASIQTVAEVGVKLGVTIWRKLFPGDIKFSDDYLCTTIVNGIKDDVIQYALSIAEFAVNQNNVSSEQYQRMFVINYAQSLKWDKNESKCLEVLDNYDWSACSAEFQLAVAVLKDDFDLSNQLMITIGSKCYLVRKMDYLVWPLFRKFIKSDQFKSAFKSIYEQDPVLIQTKEAIDATISNVDL